MAGLLKFLTVFYAREEARRYGPEERRETAEKERKRELQEW